LAVTIFGIVLAWGKNFSAINYFLFDYMPFYSKFRSPTMALVMPQLAVPLLGALGLDQFLASREPKEITWKKLKTAVYLTMGLLALVGAFYFTADFKGFHDSSIKENFTQGYLQQVARGKQPTPEMQQQANELGNSIIKSLQSDRQSIFLSDLLRTFLFVALAIALVFFYVKEKIKPVILLAGLLVLSSYDLLAEGRKFLNEDNFLEAADIDAVYTASAADLKINSDPEKNFRVFDQTDQNNGPFSDSRASFFHNSIGGYHPAKLGLYQDIIEKQLGKGNMMVFNMLNTKYFIQKNPANGQPEALLNHNAFGPCWLVKSIHFVDNADEEMKGLDSINVKDTAIVRRNFQDIIKFMPVPDSTATIKLIENLNDKISYSFSAKTNQFAVFSEVYYSRGWDAYLDGKKTDYCKVDYILRGMPVPAGTHTIEFRFEPRSYHLGESISWIGSILAYILIISAIWQFWKESGKKKEGA
jgi:Bacterial membrane protein YfhO